MFIYLKKCEYDIVLLQETHCECSTQQMWENQWKGQSIFSNGTNDECGVAILINPKKRFEIKKVSTDSDGRIIIITTEINERMITIINVYAPNVDNPEFFTSVIKMLTKHETSSVIFAGDFNLVLDEDKDSFNRKNNNKKALAVLNAFTEEFMFCDVWRDRNPDKFMFTWHRKKPNETAARLDYIMTNYGLTSEIEECKILPRFRSDHSIVKMCINVNSNKKRGPGFWKMNNSLLVDKKYVDNMNENIDKALVHAAKFKASYKWEYVKNKCVKTTKLYAKEKAKQRNATFQKLRERLEKLQCRKTCKELLHVERESLQKEITECENEINEHIAHVTEGARIRSKAKYYEEGERCTKYFLSLEKIHASNKSIKVLNCDDGMVTRDQNKILKEQAKFYKKLYTKDPKIMFAMTNQTEQILNEQQKQDVDRPFEYEDFLNALKLMAHEKSPGIDGLTCEFYIMFHQKIGRCIWEAMLECRGKGELFRSAKRGIISLIPKKNKDPRFLKSWRPLTLLSVDHKIITKMLANRLKTVINKIIGPQQTAYIPGRYIGCNIRKLLDLLMFLEQEQIQAVLLTLDFEKCFDSVSHEALISAMRYFNIGEYFISWVQMIYNNFELCVTNNGFHSEYFKQTRGVHQGCGFSGPGFLCVAEILAINIKQNPKIKGVQVGQQEELISQYADDTSLVSEFTQESIEEIILELEKFQKSTGLTVNYEKSKIYKVGAARHSTWKIKLSRKFQWSNNSIDFLGIIVNIDRLNELEEENYAQLIEQANNILKSWHNRRMSLCGKIQIVNSLVASIFIYRMQQLPLLSSQTTKELERLVTEFIWNGRKPKIRLEMLMLKNEQGGRKLTNIRERDKSQKVMWIQRVADNTDPVLKYLAEYHMNVKIDYEIFWECNIAPDDCGNLNCKSQFWKDLMYAWACYNHSRPTEIDEICNQVLWYNSYIRIANEPILYRKAYEAEIIYIKDLFPKGEVLKHEVKERFGQCMSTMQYNVLISAIPREWKNEIKQ